ncbi:hypothetical protein JZ751_028674 [Albula glossodonta]|uniref:Transcription cofactor vestigial-like protein 4 n=1 Tax=Albula glossodonta TaxID=121402 RepID=A0A8T2NAK7_9TELE|nr:hypothetical protein JZ751_028674 [Albula glossodonta]
MAVTNFHYITRMSSGFKVYILDGQPNSRTEDRFRHMTNEKARISPVYPIKRKHSPDRHLVAVERCAKPRRAPLALTSRERAFRNLACSIQRMSRLTPPQSPTSPTTPSSAISTTSWSPNHSPAHRSLSPIPSPAHSNLSPTLSPMYSTPPMDEPLALIKKPRRDQEETNKKANSSTCSQIQFRPSVITCVSSSTSSAQLSPQSISPTSSVTSPPAYDHVVEEHFRRSLGVNYHKKTNPCQLSVSVSVDDHFAKALGEKWFQLKASSSLHSSSPSPTSNSVFTFSTNKS